MKRKIVLFVLIPLVAGVGLFLLKARKKLPPGVYLKEAVGRAKTVHSFLIAHSTEHDGYFPENPAVLLLDQADFLTPIFDYRGAGMKSDSDTGQLLFRFRISKVPGKEVRVTVGGRCWTASSEESLP